jgi:hypothetical protein
VRDLQPELWNKGLKLSDSTILLIKKYLFQEIDSNTSVNNIRNNLKTNFIKIWNEDLSLVIDTLINSYLLFKVERYDIFDMKFWKPIESYMLTIIVLEIYSRLDPQSWNRYISSSINSTTLGYQFFFNHIKGTYIVSSTL